MQRIRGAEMAQMETKGQGEGEDRGGEKEIKSNAG